MGSRMHPGSVAIEMMDNICMLPEDCLVHNPCLIKDNDDDDDNDDVDDELPYSENTLSG